MPAKPDACVVKQLLWQWLKRCIRFGPGMISRVHPNPDSRVVLGMIGLIGVQQPGCYLRLVCRMMPVVTQHHVMPAPVAAPVFGNPVLGKDPGGLMCPTGTACLRQRMGKGLGKAETDLPVSSRSAQGNIRYLRVCCKSTAQNRCETKQHAQAKAKAKTKTKAEFWGYDLTCGYEVIL